jgi:hypothetical protein
MQMTYFAILVLGASSLFAADELLIPAPLNQVLTRIKPGMTGAEVKTVLVTAYPKALASLGDWDGMTGYVDFRLNERYSVSFSAHSPPGGAPSESSARLGKNLLTYVFDHQLKHRLQIRDYQWDTPAEAEPKAKPEHYHFVQSQVADEVPMTGPVGKATIYVLLCPGHRAYVFRTFDSLEMEAVVKLFPRGSVLHYDGNAMLAPPSQTQIEKLAALCKSKGISLELTPTN